MIGARCLLQHERYLSLPVDRGARTEALIEKPIRALNLPHGCLVAVIRRGGASIVPDGDTVLREGDILTIIGDEPAVREVHRLYGHEAAGGSE